MAFPHKIYDTKQDFIDAVNTTDWGNPETYVGIYTHRSGETLAPWDLELIPYPGGTVPPITELVGVLDIYGSHPGVDPNERWCVECRVGLLNADLGHSRGDIWYIIKVIT